jgi:hypothetical protein
MRFVCALAAAIFLSATPPAASAQDSAPSDTALAAARDMTSALIVESGLLDAALDTAFADLMPRLRAEYAGLTTITPAHRDAALAFIETLPALVRTELQGAIGQAIEAAAPELAAIYSEETMIAAAAFFRREEMRALLVRGVQTDWKLTEQDHRLLEEFEGSAQARGLLANAAAFGDVLERAFRRTTGALLPSLMLRVYQGLCSALEEECPASIRERIAPI